jgi:divalent metal cation (Fe/Co/Zn/Cd) transporter
MSVSIAVFERPAIRWESLVFRARALVVFGLLWHSIEAAATLAAGIPASSSALVGFGADVTVETVGGFVLLWRLSSARALSESAERTAQRLIGVSYWLLAAFVVYDSTQVLLSGQRPDSSVLGIVIAVLALIVMPPLRRAKARVGDRLGSSAVKREGRENMMCAYLSICLLAGLGLNAALGWWWADPVSAYGVAAIAAVAGRRAWLGVNCCAAQCCAIPSQQIQGGIST